MAKKTKQFTAAPRRSAARLAAAQALYLIEITGAAEDDVLRDFLEGRLGGRGVVSRADELGEEVEIEQPLVEPDPQLFTRVVRGVSERREELDTMIKGALAPGWTLERLEAVLRAVLRAGAFELMAVRDVPPRVAISEYVDVARAFYAGDEPGLVNAVLDRIAHVVRAEDFEDGRRRAP